MGVVATAWTGSKFTSASTGSEWYQCIKPGLTPPAAVFPVVWTMLYILLIAAFGRALTTADPLLVGLFIINLILNAMWCYWYFKERNISYALGNIVALWATTISILWVGQNDKLIVACVLPYLGWITFAALLNMLSLDNASKCNIEK